MHRNFSLKLTPFRLEDGMALAVGLGTWITVRIFSVLTLAELIMPAFLILLFARSGGLPFQGKRLNQIIVLTILYFVGIAAANAVNGWQTFLAIRGLARPLFILMITLFFAYLAFRSPRSIFYFWCGSLLGAVKNYLRGSGIESLDSNIFVYQLQPLITSFCLILAFIVFQKSRPLASAIFFFYGGVSMLKGGRSFALVCFAAAATIFFMWYFQTRGHRMIRPTKTKIVTLGLVAILGLFAAFYGYAYVVKQGWMGEAQLKKYRAQTSTVYGETPWGLLLSGRLGVLVFGKIIVDNPFFGLGSWPEIGDYMIEAAGDLGNTLSPAKMAKLGYSTRGGGHSIFLGAWGQHGLAGAVYWFVILWMTVKVSLFFFKVNNRLSVFFIYPFFFLAWAWLFSPWGTLERMLFGMFLGFYIVYADSGIHRMARAGGPPPPGLPAPTHGRRMPYR